MSRTEYDALIASNAKIAQAMTLAGFGLLLLSFVTMGVFVGYFLMPAALATVAIGISRTIFLPKPGRYYLAPGLFIGAINLVAAVLIWSSASGFRSGGVWGYLVAPFLWPICGIVGVAVIFAGLVRSAEVNAIVRELPSDLPDTKPESNES